MIGTTQASMQALMNEKFSPFDIPESYEQRIRPFTYSIVDANCLPILYNHLPENLELRVRISNSVTKDAFFTNLRNCWLESKGHRAIQNPQQTIPIQNNPQPIQQINPTSLPLQQIVPIQNNPPHYLQDMSIGLMNFILINFWRNKQENMDIH
jgi:hypothetical protein